MLQVTQANGTAEREAALAMVRKVASKKGKTRRITLAADKNFDTQEFVHLSHRLPRPPHRRA